MLSRGFVGSLCVLFGGLVIATLPPSTALMRLSALDTLRAAEAGRMLGLAVVMVGLGLLAAAWLRLCRYAADAPESAEALATVRHALVVWSAPLVLAPPLFSRDGWSYAAQGMLVHVGLSPYRVGPGALQGPIVEAVDPIWMHTITPYGPLPLLFGAQAAAHTGNPWVLVIAHRLLALVGVAVLAWAVPRLAGWTGVNPALATAVAVASPLAVANGIAGLHNDIVMAGLMAAALVLAAERGWVAGAAIGGLAAAVKAPGGLVCLGVALVGLPAAARIRDRLRRLTAVALVSGGVLLGLGVVSGLGLGWVRGLAVPGVLNTPLSLTTLIGGAFDWAAAQLGLGLAPATFLGLVRHLGTLAFGVAAVVVALRSPTGRPDRAMLAVAWVLGLMVALSPVVHLWYLLWVTPWLAVLALRRAAWIALMTASVIGGLVAPLDSSLHGAYLAIVLGSLLAAISAGVLLITRGARARLHGIETARRSGRSGQLAASARSSEWTASIPATVSAQSKRSA